MSETIRALDLELLIDELDFSREETVDALIRYLHCREEEERRERLRALSHRSRPNDT